MRAWALDDHVEGWMTIFRKHNVYEYKFGINGILIIDEYKLQRYLPYGVFCEWFYPYFEDERDWKDIIYYDIYLGSR